MKEKIIQELNKHKNTGNIPFNTKLLQIVPNGYGEGDILLGISSPNLRKIAKKYHKEITTKQIEYFIKSKYHEYRLLSLMFLVLIYEKKPQETFNFYMKNIDYINNWDLVDISSPNIIGKYLYEKQNEKEKILNKLYNSKNIWHRRIAIVSTLYLIKQNDLDFCLDFYKKTINDEHHLNNKALGWMLREIGKKNEQKLITFLKNNKVKNITFNYATEKLKKPAKHKLK